MYIVHFLDFERLVVYLVIKRTTEEKNARYQRTDKSSCTKSQD